MNKWSFWKKKVPETTLPSDETSESSLRAGITREKNRYKKQYYEELKRLNDIAEIRRMQEETEMLKAELYGDDDDDNDTIGESPEDMLMKMFISRFASGNNQLQSGFTYGGTTENINLFSTSETPSPISKAKIGKQAIMHILNQSPDVQKKMLDDYVPQLDEEAKKIIIEVVNNGKKH